MNRERVLALLERVAARGLAPSAALEELSYAPLEALGFATVDHHRSLRQGFPEVIFGGGKTAEQIVRIAEQIAGRGDGLLVTRADDEARTALSQRFPEARINILARTVRLDRTAVDRADLPTPGILIVTAGTSDLPVAEEAAETAEAVGCTVDRLADVGVAGIHRLLDGRHQLAEAGVIIVVAGMDGALPSVVGGLVSAPVIAVPTSVGYGSSFGGLAALLTMLNSCAAGVSVVNIDNGFGAGMAAARIVRARLTA